MLSQRKQYGLKHHVTFIVHETMGDTLHKIATEISTEGNDFRLWDKSQSIVMLSRTRVGSNIIFVGNNNDNLNSLSSMIKPTNQWMKYTEKILDMASVNGSEDYTQVTVFNHCE